MIATYKDYFINARATAAANGTGAQGGWIALPPVILKFVGTLRRAFKLPAALGAFSTEQAALEAGIEAARRAIDGGQIAL